MPQYDDYCKIEPSSWPFALRFEGKQVCWWQREDRCDALARNEIKQQPNVLEPQEERRQAWKQSTLNTQMWALACRNVLNAKTLKKSQAHKLSEIQKCYIYCGMSIGDCATWDKKPTNSSILSSTLLSSAEMKELKKILIHDCHEPWSVHSARFRLVCLSFWISVHQSHSQSFGERCLIQWVRRNRGVSRKGGFIENLHSVGTN